jgi:hypothetical protein
MQKRNFFLLGGIRLQWVIYQILKHNYEAGWLRHDTPKFQRVGSNFGNIFIGCQFAAIFEVRSYLGLISEVAVACATNLPTISSCVGKPGRLNRPNSSGFLHKS